ncbi:MAG: cytochrome c biogenesis protein CcdA [Methanolinea sp.]|jgi:cytochrome c biogenesis protein CcdA/glutaredoxin|nr:cytochrome c biogenesis protein CcdA [Methanolinea sp.]
MAGNQKRREIRPFILFFVILLILACVLPVTARAETGLSLAPSAGEEPPALPVSPDHRFTDKGPVIVMFYNTNCGDCMRTLPFVQQYIRDHPELETHLLNIKENFDYWKLFSVYKEAYNTGAIPVPSVFVGDRVLIGYDEITGSLEEVVKEQSHGLSPQPSARFPSLDNISAQEITIPLVITAGLADGINPCAFSVLIILLFTLSVAGSRKRMVSVGACFIGTVFIFYFLSGLGIFYLIQLAEISRAIGIIAAAIALIFGAISLSEGVFDREKPTLAIPASRKGIIGDYIQKASVPASIVLGVLVGMFELPCTGGIYLAILSLISDKMTMAEGIPLLLVYNVFFVLPLVLILCAVVFGLPLERVDRWRREHRRAVRIIMGLVLLGLGVLLIGSFLFW